MTGAFVAITPCYGCGSLFEADPDSCPSILVDPQTNKAPDVDTEHVRAGALCASDGEYWPCASFSAAVQRSIRRPICPSCCETANPIRKKAGLEQLLPRTL